MVVDSALFPLLSTRSTVMDGTLWRADEEVKTDKFCSSCQKLANLNSLWMDDSILFHMGIRFSWYSFKLDLLF